MKNKLFYIFILLVIAVGLGFPDAAVSAEGIHTPVNGLEVPLCPPFNLNPDPHPGCREGTWTFPGDNQHVRNWIQIYEVFSFDDDRIVGINTLVANANFDSEGYGPGWGTFHNESSIYEGYWEGTWAAVMDENGYVSRIVGKGYGEFDGLLFRATEVNGVLEGVITDMPNN